LCLEGTLRFLEDVQSGGVDERQVDAVHDDVGVAALDGPLKLSQQRGSGGEIDLALRDSLRSAMTRPFC
jgi:hypothetical protein